MTVSPADTIATLPVQEKWHGPGIRPVDHDTARAPVRILTFTSIFPNPAQPHHGVFVSRRIEALAKLAHVEVVAPVPWAPPVRGLPDRFYRCSAVPWAEVQNGLTVHHPRFVAIPRVLKSADPALMALSCLPAVLAVRRRFPFDLIDAHWACPDGVAAALLAAMTGVPFSITVRGDDLNVFALEPGRGRVIRWALRRAARVIAVSQDLAQRAIELGARSDRVAVIPNGVDSDRFRPRDRAASRVLFGLPVDARVLLSVGRLHTSKGFVLLVEALARLADDYRDVHLVIVGEPDGEADATPGIRAAVERNALHDRVHLVGAQPPDRLASWYSAADLFCLATTREGSANVLLEALACGLPCVTTDVGGNRDAITDERLGLLTSPDASSFASAIARGLAHPWDRAVLVRAADSQGWDRVARACYEHLLPLVTVRRVVS